MKPPFIVQRNGTVLERKGGAVIGRVYLSHTDGWVALGLGDQRLEVRYPNRRKWAARTVWEASPYYKHRTRE